MTRSFRCKGGPFDGKELWLSDAPHTAVVEFGSWRGRYASNAFNGVLYWEWR